MELIQELRDSMREGSLGTMIHHRYLVEIAFIEEHIERYNKIYNWKKEEAIKRLKNKDYEGYIYIHEKPYRLEALLVIADNLKPKELGPLLLDVYNDSEAPMVNKEYWVELFAMVGRKGMDEEERNFFNELPDRFTVYRGCLDEHSDGMSWTTDKTVAEFFARRVCIDGRGKVIEKEISKKEVVTCICGRNEKEVILFPKEYRQGSTS